MNIKPKVESLESRQLLSVSPIEGMNAQLLEHSFEKGFRKPEWRLDGERYDSQIEGGHWVSGLATDGSPIENYRWDAWSVADFNGDGVIDVLGGSGANFWLDINDGQQLFHMPWEKGFPCPRVPEATCHDRLRGEILATLDFNGDDIADLLTLRILTLEIAS